MKQQLSMCSNDKGFESFFHYLYKPFVEYHSAVHIQLKTKQIGNILSYIYFCAFLHSLLSGGINGLNNTT